MDIVSLIKNTATFFLMSVIFIYTIISILRLKKKNPPAWITQYVRYLNIIFFIFGILITGFIITPAGSDFSIFMYLFLTLIVYVLFYAFGKAFRYKYFKLVEQGINIYVYIILILSFFAYINGVSSFTIANIGILTLEIILSSFLIYIFLKSKSVTNKYYSLFFANIIFSSLIGLVYAIFLKNIWVESILIGRTISVIGFTIPLIIISFRYYKEYVDEKKKPAIFLNEQIHIFKINNDILIKLKDYSLKKDEDINGIIDRLINI